MQAVLTQTTRGSHGSHRDNDVQTFVSRAAALYIRWCLDVYEVAFMIKKHLFLTIEQLKVLNELILCDQYNVTHLIQRMDDNQAGIDTIFVSL